MIGLRIRLTTSRKPSYRRGGVAIGNLNAPTFIGPGDVTPEQLLAILRDPNIAIAIETEEDVFRALTAEERADIEEQAEGALFDANAPGDPAQSNEPNTAEPQGGGSDPDAEASKVSGPEATDNASDGSAAVAGTPDTGQPDAADPVAGEPAQAPAPPTSSGTRKPKAVKAKP